MRFSIVIHVLLCAVLLAACGSGNGEPSAGDEGEAAVETVTPRDQRVAVPTMPVANFAQPTSMIDPTRMAASAGGGNETPAEVDLAQGEQVYMDQCAGCHGPDGQGVDDLGGTVAGLQIEEAAFMDLLRTGGQGELGDEHQFGTPEISEEAMAALYAYVVALE